ncbi:MAG: signal peptidase I [Lachnospiraceae bacterium]
MKYGIRVWIGFLQLCLGVCCCIGMLLCIPQLFGMKPMVVLSGSMEPTYQVGSLLYVREISFTQVTKGMPVTFTLGDTGALVTHRAIEVNAQAQTVVTQGDANEIPDGKVVAGANIVGTPIGSIPYLGYLAMYLDTTKGKSIAVFLILLITVCMGISEYSKQGEKEERNAGK